MLRLRKTSIRAVVLRVAEASAQGSTAIYGFTVPSTASCLSLATQGETQPTWFGVRAWNWNAGVWGLRTVQQLLWCWPKCSPLQLQCTLASFQKGTSPHRIPLPEGILWTPKPAHPPAQLTENTGERTPPSHLSCDLQLQTDKQWGFQLLSPSGAVTLWLAVECPLVAQLLAAFPSCSFSHFLCWCFLNLSLRQWNACIKVWSWEKQKKTRWVCQCIILWPLCESSSSKVN